MKRAIFLFGLLALLGLGAADAQIVSPLGPTTNPGCAGLSGSAGVISGCTGATTGQQALSNLSGVYVLCRGAGIVAHTGDTTETALGTCAVPANAMGANGHLRITFMGEYTNNADNKVYRIRFSGISGTVYQQVSVTTTASYRGQVEIANLNATNSQSGIAAGANGFGAGNTAVTSAVDTTQASSIVITGQLATTTDNIQVDSWIVELIASAGN